MADERQDEKTEPDAIEAAATTTDGLEDLAPSQDESDGVTGGSAPPGTGGWNRVKNPEP
jgi:hypothetical protein